MVLTSQTVTKSGSRSTPYSKQPPRAFWRRMVEGVHPLAIEDWYRAKFAIDGAAVAAGGSCFAQHIGDQLKKKGFRFLDVEPPPSILPASLHKEFGFGWYSARYGNIYTARQLRQLVERALGEFHPANHVWRRDSGFVDAFRPQIEPTPFASHDEVETFRKYHLGRVAHLFETMSVFVFTMGLTEAWISTLDGAAFPLAPGVAGGEYDPNCFRLANLSYEETLADMESVIAKLRNMNPSLSFLLTVSPVPLAATATGNHVVVATTYSKAVLRAVAGALADKYDFVDYFPSYEIIASTPMRAMFFNPDMRAVSSFGVEHVMKHFFAVHEPPKHVTASQQAAADKPSGGKPNIRWKQPGRGRREPAVDPDAVKCDEELLSAFGANAQ